MDLRPSSWGPSGPAPSRTGMVLADDGERISVAYDAPAAGAAEGLVLVVSHGFTGGWRRPDNRAIALALKDFGGVVSYDSRGHGASSGVTTIGDQEVLDLDAAIGYARWLGARRIVTAGFSMGGSIVLRQAALASEEARPDAVVSVSAAGFWFYKGTPPMRLLHRAVGTRLGRTVLRTAFGTRVTDQEWTEPYPLSPSESAAMIPPVPLLVVHGDRDTYFPVEHARSLEAAAAEGAARRGVEDRTTAWLLEGFAHAESATDDELVARIGAWATAAVADQTTPEPLERKA
ncbi:MAG: alpha/beta fold hydrolase [Candidatus Nanopelagicales bacterium]